MSSSSDSDSEDDIHPSEIEFAISQHVAMKNYQEAGNLVPEQRDQISFEKYGHLMNSSNDKILEAVLAELALPYQLAEFQTLRDATLKCKILFQWQYQPSHTPFSS